MYKFTKSDYIKSYNHIAENWSVRLADALAECEPLNMGFVEFWDKCDKSEYSDILIGFNHIVFDGIIAIRPELADLIPDWGDTKISKVVELRSSILTLLNIDYVS